MSSPLPPVPGPLSTDEKGRLTPPWQAWFLQLYNYLVATQSGGGGVVPPTRNVITTLPLEGGGSLGNDLTLSVNTFGASQTGVVPASGGGTTNYLRADGTWAAAPSTPGAQGSPGVAVYLEADQGEPGNDSLLGIFNAQATFANITLNGAAIPANGLYLSAANTLAFATASTQRGTVNSTGNWTISAPSSGLALTSPSNAFTAVTITNAIQTPAAAATIASAATIAPTALITFISGTAAISTITAPGDFSTGGGFLILIPTGNFTTTTVGGNIGLASTAVTGKALFMTYDKTTAKWYPSY